MEVSDLPAELLPSVRVSRARSALAAVMSILRVVMNRVTAVHKRPARSEKERA
jgi:hypothetical protein